MKIKELINLIMEKVTIYKSDGDGFLDIYKGETKGIPLNVLEMEVRCIGAKRKGVLDIWVC